MSRYGEGSAGEGDDDTSGLKNNDDLSWNLNIGIVFSVADPVHFFPDPDPYPRIRF